MYKYVYVLRVPVAHRELLTRRETGLVNQIKGAILLEERVIDECCTDAKTYPGMCASL
jgi:hypothetical protein